MSVPESRQSADQLSHPPLLRDPSGHVDVDSVPDVIQWFLDYDSRVAIIKHPRLKRSFNGSRNKADRTTKKYSCLAGLRIVWQLGLSRLWARTPRNAAFTPGLGSCSMRSTRPQRLTKPFLRPMAWTSQLTSIVTEATKIPTQRGRNDFLVNCWVETLCTAEARVLGWLYKEFYGRPYSPNA